MKKQRPTKPEPVAVPWGQPEPVPAPQCQPVPASPPKPAQAASPVPYGPRFTPANASKYPHYFKAVNQTHIDIYWVLDNFNTGSSALDHAVKKLLVPGGRGAKDRLTDLKEALASLKGAIEALENQR